MKSFNNDYFFSFLNLQHGGGYIFFDREPLFVSASPTDFPKLEKLYYFLKRKYKDYTQIKYVGTSGYVLFSTAKQNEGKIICWLGNKDDKKLYHTSLLDLYFQYGNDLYTFYYDYIDGEFRIDNSIEKIISEIINQGLDFQIESKGTYFYGYGFNTINGYYDHEYFVSSEIVPNGLFWQSFSKQVHLNTNKECSFVFDSSLHNKLLICNEKGTFNMMPYNLDEDSINYLKNRSIEINKNNPNTVKFTIGVFERGGKGTPRDYYFYISDKDEICRQFEQQKIIFANRLSFIKTKILELANKTINNQAIKTAQSAIMSRNMSHNLGSHVMSYIKQSLSSVENMFQDNILAQPFENKTDREQSLPFLLGLGHFFAYLQERQDFIATIATDYIPIYSTVNFKDYIYDELNPDKRYQRHNERKELEIDNILLGNIAQSEGLGRKISPTKDATLADIVLKFRDFDGNTPNPGSNAENSLEEMRKYDLSIPGGVVGRQAIFSIVENVIRNAAKHGNWRDAGKLELTFDIYDYCHDKDSERLSTNDNVDDKSLSLREVIDRYYFFAKDKYDNYIFTLTDNLSISKESLGNLRRALGEKYIDPVTGTMNNGNKGLKEMRISSAWIRAIDEENSEFTLSYMSEKNEFLSAEGFQDDKNWYYKSDDAKNKLSPLIYARISKSNEGTQRLQYIFCVPIPKKIAVVSNKFNDAKINNDAESKLSKHGWRLYSPEEFLDRKTDKSFEFIILDDVEKTDYSSLGEGDLYRFNNELYCAIRQQTSSRLIRLSSIVSFKGIIEKLLEGSLKEEDYDDIYLDAYRYISNYQEGDKIAILDKTANDKYSGLPHSFDVPSGGTYLSAANDKVSISDGIKVEPYIYCTHHESKSEFLNFMNHSVQGGAFQNYKYVEGISGNNSTDRFVRNDNIDDIWFYKHLHSMKTKVAIFDERIFSKVFGLKESDFYGETVATADNIKIIKRTLQQEYPDDLYEYAFLDTPDELNQYLSSKNLSSERDCETDNYSAKIFEQKNVFVYSLIRSKTNPSTYHLVGLKDFKKRGEKYICHCGRIASLSWGMENETLTITSSINKIPGQFDKISIHQGLLDKLYTAFGIKNHENEIHLKEKLTYDLYKYFARHEDEHKMKSISKNDNLRMPWDNKEDDTIFEKNKRWFLPRMTIHSGRSKPDGNDMPQRIPFVQYAAIEHAVFDSKLSLVELLDFARYE